MVVARARLGAGAVTPRGSGVRAPVCAMICAMAADRTRWR